MGIAGAIVGAAVIGGGASMIASGKAAGAARDAASQNNALQSQIYQQNTANLDPWMQRGNAAGNQINAMLGLGSGTSGAPDYAAYVQNNPDLMAEFNRVGGQFGNNMGAYGQFHWNTYGQNEGRTLPNSGGAAAADPNAAFNSFLNSSGYKFALGEGMNAVNNNLATKGALNSGAALKAINNYAQNMATQNAFLPYMNLLSQQDQRGMAAGSAIAGVGQNYANAVSSNNNNAAAASGNAAIAGANGINSMIGSGLNAFGMSQGFGSSYGGNSAGSFATPRGFGTGPIGNGGGEWS